MAIDTLLESLHVMGLAVVHIERRVGVTFGYHVEAGVRVINFI